MVVTQLFYTGDEDIPCSVQRQIHINKYFTFFSSTKYTR